MICQVIRKKRPILFYIIDFFFEEYTDMSMSQIMQRQSIHYSGNTGVLRHLITQVAGLLEPVEGDKKTRAFNAIDITIDSKIVTLEVILFKKFVFVV
jgi:hypothetical protein